LVLDDIDLVEWAECVFDRGIGTGNFSSKLDLIDVESYSIGIDCLSPESRSSIVRRAEINGIEGSIAKVIFEPASNRASPLSLDRFARATRVYSGYSMV
jgi:hypothetical protein